jgi:hypothetical protein
MIPAGKYVARAQEGVWCKVGQNSTPGVGVRFEFQLEGKQAEIWHVMYLTEAARPYTFEALVKLGYDETHDLVAKDGNLTFAKQHLADKEVEIVVEHEEYNGKSRAKVKYINEIGGGNLKGLTVQQVLGNVSLRSELAAARARLGAPRPATAEPKSVMQQMNDANQADQRLPF